MFCGSRAKRRMVEFERRVLLAEDSNSAFAKMLAAEKTAVGVDGDGDGEGAQAKVWEAKCESGVGDDMLGKADSGEVDLDDRDDAAKVCEGRLVQSEGKSRGGVTLATHSKYIHASGSVLWVVQLLLLDLLRRCRRRSHYYVICNTYCYRARYFANRVQN
eukprot:Plantae.Rhodophyta-Palmaria_palmata.ctg2523.p1 GENE.Plantae.Rhodophyta-Palmaria_palmata.ctg2523~~Plantae.Rhodophyta-Palmaria_palmata.ctg2523.p1  ORF type:complete len:160 (-),score=21.33 Plantae.Rhodophyta-Palmaria_palmata.ctg2523:48-527(-)